MARRRKPEPEGSQGAVSDAAGFLFAPDPAPPALRARGPRQTSGPKPTAAAEAAPPHHLGHRERLRAKFADAGPGALADYEMLELYLFRVLHRRDTKPLAKALIARFGTLAGVLGAEAAQLMEVEGSGAAVAQELKIAHALAQRAARVDAVGKPVVSSWSQLLGYCRIAMAQAGREQFRVLYLDIRNQLLGDEVLNEGTIDHAPVYPREVVRRALAHNAAAVILVHNHPSGDPRPSAADAAITREIVAALKTVSVTVHDHVIIGRSGEASFKALGLL